MNNYYLIKFAQATEKLPGFDQPVRKEFADRYNRNMKEHDSYGFIDKLRFLNKINKQDKQETSRLTENRFDPYFSKNNFPRNNLPNGPVDTNGIGFGSPGYKPNYTPITPGKTLSHIKKLYNDPNGFSIALMNELKKDRNVIDRRPYYIQDLMMQNMGFKTSEELKQYYDTVDKNRQEMGLMKPGEPSTWSKVQKDGKIAPKIDVALAKQPHNPHKLLDAYFAQTPIDEKTGKITPEGDKLIQKNYFSSPGSYGVAYTDSSSIPHEVYGHGTFNANGNYKVVNAANNPKVPTTTLLNERVVPMLQARMFGGQPYLSFKDEAGGFEARMARYVRRKYNNGQPFKGEGEKVREILNNPNHKFKDDPGLQGDYRRYMDDLRKLPQEEQKKYIDEYVKRIPAYAQNNQIQNGQLRV